MTETAVSPTESIVYVMPDKMGGVFTVARNLLNSREPDGRRYTAVFTHKSGGVDTRSDHSLPVDEKVIVEHDTTTENLYAVMRRLRRSLPAGGGAIVCNDWLELATASTYDLGKAIVTITHGDYEYYYALAERYQDAIDMFIAHTSRIHQQLLARLPHRTEDILHIPYGVDIPAALRTAHDGCLRVLYVGRFDENKGVGLLPGIAAAVAAAGVEVTWTLIGDGPDATAVQRVWPSHVPVVFLGSVTLEQTLAEYPLHDVLVLPSRNEGLPAVLLEAGAAGVVPVVTDIQSGIPEIVADAVTGFRIRHGDVAGFARAICTVSGDRAALDRMGLAIRARVERDFDIRVQAPAYQRAIDSAIQRRSRRRPVLRGPRAGSRLDRWWLPARLVRSFRTWRQH